MSGDRIGGRFLKNAPLFRLKETMRQSWQYLGDAEFGAASYRGAFIAADGGFWPVARAASQHCGAGSRRLYVYCQ